MAASAPQKTSQGMSIEVDGQRVPLSAAGLERALSERREVGKKLTEAVREAVERSSED